MSDFESDFEKEERPPEETPKSLETRGEKLPTENGAQDVEAKKGKTQNDPKNGDAGASVSLRYRAGNAYLWHRIGLATALLILAVAVVLISVTRHTGTENPPETTSGADSTSAGESESGTGENGENTESDTTEEHSLYDFDPSLVPEGEIPIRAADLSGDAGSVTNKTALSLDVEALAALLRNKMTENGSAPDATPSEPLVLILHTHTTESYSAVGAISFDGIGELARSENAEEGVSAVGAALAEALNGAGVPTLHATIFHDVTEDGTVTYAGAYERAAETIRAYRTLYPTIRYVIDVGRDVVFDESGNLVRAVTVANGEPAAQVMTVVGSGDGTGYEANLSLALLLTEALNADGAALCRAPVLEDAFLNQSLSVYGLTLEIGTAGNNLNEAKTAASLVGEALAKLILQIER